MLDQAIQASRRVESILKFHRPFVVRKWIVAAVLAAASVRTGNVFAGSYAWTSATTGGLWSDSANWGGTVPTPGDTASNYTFNANNSYTSTNDLGPVSVQFLTANIGAGSGNTLTLAGNGYNLLTQMTVTGGASSIGVSFSAPVTVSGATSFYVAASRFVITAGGIDTTANINKLNGGVLYLQSSDANSSPSAAGSSGTSTAMTTLTSGTLTISQGALRTDSLTIASGENVNLGSANSTSTDVPTLVLVRNGNVFNPRVILSSEANAAAKLTIGGINTVGTTTFSNYLSPQSATDTRTLNLTAATGGTVQFNQTLIGNSAMSLLKQNNGTVVLKGVGVSDTDKSYAGTTTVRTGTLVLSADDYGNTAAGTVLPGNGHVSTGFGGVLGYTAYSTPVALGDASTAAGDKVALLATAGVYVGHNLNVVNKGAGTTIGSTDTGSTYWSGNIALAKTASFTAADSASFSGEISGAGGLTKEGGGTVSLSGTNTYAGPTTISAGTLRLVDTGSIAGTSGVTNNATLTYDRSGSSTAGYAISGSGAVIKSGAGTQILAGANSYTGATTVSAGTLQATSAAYATVLNASNGGLNLTAGKFVFDYTGTASPIGTIKLIIDAGFDGNYTTSFQSGRIRSTGRSASSVDLTLGYADDGLNLATVMVTVPGDANLDGKVDFNDFLVLQNNFNIPDTTFGQGNFNYDAKTDFNDFLVLQNHFNQSVTGAPAGASAAEVSMVASITSPTGVPEPMGLTAVALTAFAFGHRRRR